MRLVFTVFEYGDRANKFIWNPIGLVILKSLNLIRAGYIIKMEIKLLLSELIFH